MSTWIPDQVYDTNTWVKTDTEKLIAESEARTLIQIQQSEARILALLDTLLPISENSYCYYE